MKTFVSAMIVVVLLIFGIVLVSSLAGGKNVLTTKVGDKKSLVDYADTDATVTLRIKGAINADETHREIQITVGRTSRNLSIIQGYSNTVIRSETLYNTQNAYDEFLHAIDGAKFTKEHKISNPQSDIGVCPLGKRYEFSLSQNNKDITNLWSTNCAARGTSAGNRVQLTSLFQAQIPGYAKKTQDVNL